MNSNGAKFQQQQGNSVNCGASAFTVSLNIMLGLTGSSAYNNLSVWSSSAFGSDSTVSIGEKGQAFLRDQGLSGKIKFEYAPNDITTTAQMKAELQKGNCVVVSSGGTSQFRNANGSTPRSYPDGHFIMFYNYSGGTYFANDSAVEAARGAGVPYSESQLKQWLDGRSYHTGAIMSKR